MIWGAIISGAVSIVSAIFGGSKKRKVAAAAEEKAAILNTAVKAEEERMRIALQAEIDKGAFKDQQVIPGIATNGNVMIWIIGIAILIFFIIFKRRKK